MPDIAIEQITPILTWQLRRDVLYPGEYKHNMEMPEDEDGTHFGAFTDNKLVGVISLFNNGADYQFRKFAVESSMQNQGIGMQMLQYVTEHVKNHGGTRLWCNARVDAIPFYTKAGFKATDEHFTRKGIGYVIMEKLLQ